MYHQFDRTLHPRQSVLNIIMNMNEQNKQLEEDIRDLESKIKQCKNGILTKDLVHAVHPESPTLKTSLCLKEQSLLPVSDTLRAVEGSSPADNRYCDYTEEFSKSEPAVVSLEYGVARMTC